MRVGNYGRGRLGDETTSYRLGLSMYGTEFDCLLCHRDDEYFSITFLGRLGDEVVHDIC